MLIHWIWLATRQNITDRDKAALLEHFRDPEAVFFASEEQLNQLPEQMRAALQDKDLTEAQSILQSCGEKEIHICTYQDAAYPARLKNIADPPLVLYYKGRLPQLDDGPVIAVVGTRKASGYGLKTASRISYQIASYGATVVTGLAEGIDGAAATGALMGGAAVVGVLGCGADIVYPAFHRSLYADTQSRGCLLTEFPPGTPPYKWNFPKRNRIISGLCNGVLVVEAPAKSGALITARQAAEQGRDVFAVPGNVDVPTFEGSNALLREGAIHVNDGWDVVSEYAYLYPDKVRKPPASQPLPQVAQKPMIPVVKNKANRKKDKKPIDNRVERTYSVNHDTLTDQEKKLVAVLEQGPCLKDTLIEKTAMSAAQASAVLTMLQIKGVVEAKPGNIFALK